MTLIINNHEVQKLLTMEDTLAALEQGYLQLAAGEAVCRPRIDIRIPTSDPAKNYQWGTMEGGSTAGYFVSVGEPTGAAASSSPAKAVRSRSFSAIRRRALSDIFSATSLRTRLSAKNEIAAETTKAIMSFSIGFMSRGRSSSAGSMMRTVCLRPSMTSSPKSS